MPIALAMVGFESPRTGVFRRAEWGFNTSMERGLTIVGAQGGDMALPDFGASYPGVPGLTWADTSLGVRFPVSWTGVDRKALR